MACYLKQLEMTLFIDQTITTAPKQIRRLGAMPSNTFT